MLIRVTKKETIVLPVLSRTNDLNFECVKQIVYIILRRAQLAEIKTARDALGQSMERTDEISRRNYDA